MGKQTVSEQVDRGLGYFSKMKLTENMIRWAEGKLGSTQYAGWCLAFIEDAVEEM